MNIDIKMQQNASNLYPTIKRSYTMIKWDSSQGCKDFSTSTNQSMRYITLTNGRIEDIWSSQLEAEKDFEKIQHSFIIKTLQKVGMEGTYLDISSAHFSHSVVSDSLQPLGLQHTRSPCPSPIPGVYSNSCPLSQWCHPTISSSVILFSYHLQFFPASGSFQMNNIFACIRWPKYWSFSFSISPSKEYPGLISFRMDWLDLLAVHDRIIIPNQSPLYPLP